MISRDDVVEAYQRLLNREPEEAALVYHQGHASLLDLHAALARSPEFAVNARFYNFNASIDVEAIIRKHEAPRLAKPGHLVNFLGVAMNAAFVSAISHLAGDVAGVPIPANWHADMAEWGAVLRAVDLAHDSFTVVELGCGWACWMTNASVAARNRGLKTRAIGVEGDAKHLSYAHETLATNGITDYQLHHGIAAATKGTARFPRNGTWDAKPIFTDADGDELEMIALPELLSGRADLLHMDIQGGEAALVQSCISEINERVAYLVIGTHSRQIEGALFDALHEWVLEVERPCILRDRETIVDGIQGWRNPRLT